MSPTILNYFTLDLQYTYMPKSTSGTVYGRPGFPLFRTDKIPWYFQVFFK